MLHFAENFTKIGQLVWEIWAVEGLQKQKESKCNFSYSLAVFQNQYFRIPTDLAWSQHMICYENIIYDAINQNESKVV